jgi:Flp pilus assembly pilin Flp
MTSLYLARSAARRISRRGQTLVEYALILAFIAVVAIGVLMAMGGSIKTTFANTNVQLSNAQLGGVTAQRGGG